MKNTYTKIPTYDRLGINKKFKYIFIICSCRQLELLQVCGNGIQPLKPNASLFRDKDYRNLARVSESTASANKNSYVRHDSDRRGLHKNTRVFNLHFMA
jgi:hypothetical protein